MRSKVSIVIALLLFCCLSANAANLLTDPSFETWAGWTRWSNDPGPCIWHSTWIGWTDGHTGPGYTVLTRDVGENPAVNEYMYQNVAVQPGQYEASMWFKSGGNGGAWDGPGGADQWADFRVYYWADAACTVWNGWEGGCTPVDTVMPQWTQRTKLLTVPDGTVAASFYAIANIVNPWDAAWAAWDDAYLGVVPEPGSLTALAAGLAGFAALRRRR